MNQPALRLLACVVAGLAIVACGGGGDAPSAVPAFTLLTSQAPLPATDRFEVWVCHVPDTTADPVYLPGGGRLNLTPGDVADRLEASVPEYFADLSGGAYRLGFVAGGEVAIDPSASHQACIDDALDASGAGADAVYVVADAEHGGDQPGGLAQPGTGCSCPARTSRRVVYVGASDFHPDWGPVPAVDLSEHEIGHTLGLPHSGDATTTAAEHAYASALDVMSNSAAPRDADPARRHGPATIAANLLALGWLAPSHAAVVPPAGRSVDLSPSNLGSAAAPLGASDDPRSFEVAVVGLDEFRLLTVELLAPSGYDDHLPHAGVAVHLIDQSPGVCGHADGVPCTGIDRRHVVLGSPAPHADLLTAGESFTTDGWSIRVQSVAGDGSSASVSVAPA